MTETDDRQTEQIPGNPPVNDRDRAEAQMLAGLLAAPKPWPPSLSLSPRACGTCKARRLTGQPAQHQECSMRAVLAQAPDHPCYDDLVDLSYAQRQDLPARFHVPVWDGDGVPHAWLCAVCWDDGEVCRWPCATAAKYGGEVFER